MVSQDVLIHDLAEAEGHDARGLVCASEVVHLERFCSFVLGNGLQKFVKRGSPLPDLHLGLGEHRVELVDEGRDLLGLATDVVTSSVMWASCKI